jgi:tetratricopeptide (TPR) repeat protein
LPHRGTGNGPDCKRTVCCDECPFLSGGAERRNRRWHGAGDLFFRAIRDPYYAAGAGANLAEASFELGDLDGAARYAAEVIELGNRHAAPYARFTLGQIDLARDAPQAAMANFAESMQLAQQNDDPFMVAYAQRALGQAHLTAADLPAAQQHINSALALFRQLDIPGEVAATEQLLAELRALPAS